MKCDGQHRFTTAKELEIPVYYIVDPTGEDKDITTRNSHMRVWKTPDFFRFYEFKNDFCKYVINLSRMFRFPLHSCMYLACSVIGIRINEVIKKFEKGEEISINQQQKNSIELFLEIFSNYIKKAKITLPNIASTCCTKTYLIAFHKLFEDDIKNFNKCLDVLLSVELVLPSYSKVHDVYELLVKISKKRVWKPLGELD